MAGLLWNLLERVLAQLRVWGRNIVCVIPAPCIPIRTSVELAISNWFCIGIASINTPWIHALGKVFIKSAMISSSLNIFLPIIPFSFLGWNNLSRLRLSVIVTQLQARLLESLILNSRRKNDRNSSEYARWFDSKSVIPPSVSFNPQIIVLYNTGRDNLPSRVNYRKISPHGSSRLPAGWPSTSKTEISFGCFLKITIKRKTL